MFKNSGYTYKIVNNQIIVSKANAVAAVEKQQQQQAKKVTGCVKDALGEPIIGASVVEKGAPTNGTITDFDGNFTLTVSGNELQISYIGYLPQVVKVQSGVTSYNVTLKEDTKTLDEVVVIGYGTQKKVNLTGAVASVSTDVLIIFICPLPWSLNMILSRTSSCFLIKVSLHKYPVNILICVPFAGLVNCIDSLTKSHSCNTIILRYNNISLMANTDQLIINRICSGSNHNYFTII